MVVAPIVMLLAAQAPPALDRYASYMKRADAVAVQFTVKIPDNPQIGTGSILVDRPNRMLFKLNWFGASFAHGATENGIVELEASGKTYLEFPARDRLYMPSSELTGIATVGFPLGILTMDLRQLIPANSNWKSERAVLNGTSSDHVWAEFRGDSSGRLDAWIADDGRVLRYKLDVTGMTRRQLTFDFKNYQLLTRPPLSKFQVAIPDDFLADRLPNAQFPLEVGSLANLVDWRTPNGDKIPRGAAALLVVLGPNCGPSRRGLSTWTELNRAADARGITFAVLSTARTPAGNGWLSQFRTYNDPLGVALDKLNVSATPTIYLVDRGNIVQRVWMGYDPKDSAYFIKDVTTVMNKFKRR